MNLRGWHLCLFQLLLVCSNDGSASLQKCWGLLTLIHLEEHRSAGRDFAFFITLKSDAIIIIVNTCETIELTFCFLAIGQHSLCGCKMQPCQNGSCHEVLVVVVKYEIIRSKRFLPLFYLLHRHSCLPAWWSNQSCNWRNEHFVFFHRKHFSLRFVSIIEHVRTNY